MSSELIEQTVPLTDTDVTTAPKASGCPVPHAVAALAPEGVCPFPHGMGGDATTTPTGARRSHADMVVRKVLRIKDRPAHVSENAAFKAFEKSMLISATRCTLTYVVFPFVLPMVHVLKGVAPVLGIIIGVLAMCCDVFTIRRFFAIDHKWRWYFAAVASSVICLLAVLLVQDIVHLINGTSAV